ncbi:CDC50/LEM3 family [Polychytrium aggregatum]|uniref:CDC50/LEM3 family n=1 Tax=Polychytrium aggregatum TaxID=110093 RepID=UPI0022FE56A7|nr:CDC50/LEM3 family [Polychytrium aggregatum]KAI9197209.1 CDC50/LEM3 family [Polychytrium aggregatum]
MNRSLLKKPANTAFSQQRLKSSNPILTPKYAISILLAVGAILIPLGIGLYIASEKVVEVSFDYSNCNQASTSFTAPSNTQGGVVSQWKYNPSSKTCTILFNIGQTMPQPVFLYYRLGNFYQNHRFYVKSIDKQQLLGKQGSCDSLTTLGRVTLSDLNRTFPGYGGPANTWLTPDDLQAYNSTYYPCGLVANSMFTDTFSNLTCYQSDGIPGNSGAPPCSPNNTTEVVYWWNVKNINWPSADPVLYGYPSFVNSWDNTTLNKRLIPPPLWQQLPAYKNGYNKNNFPDISTDEHFQVWMRVAALPNFKKLYGRNDGMQLYPGTWSIDVVMNYDTELYSGTRSVVLSTVSFIGGKNPFLGLAYIGVGSLCILISMGLVIANMVKPWSPGDHSKLGWVQQEQLMQRSGGQ